jgi:hypothetical protein
MSFALAKAVLDENEACAEIALQAAQIASMKNDRRAYRITTDIAAKIRHRMAPRIAEG